MTESPACPPRAGWRAWLFRLALAAVVVWDLHLLLGWTAAKAKTTAAEGPLMFGLLSALLLAYAILIAVPFVPGVEIGLGLLMIRGAEIAPFVYIATVFGLMLAFAAGRCLPYRWLQRLFRDLRLTRAARLIERLQPLDHDARLAWLARALPRWARPLAGAGRYLLYALLFNTPGNGLLGGGGGIACAAGFSRLYRPLPAFAVTALAVLPVPLSVWLWGGGGLLP